MSFGTYSEKGVNYPILICDSCHLPIKDASSAIITFPNLGGNPLDEANGIYHKGKCDPGNRVKPYSNELAAYLRQLACNLKIGELVTADTKRQLVINLPEPNGFAEISGNPDW